MPDSTHQPFSLLLQFDGKATKVAGETPFTMGRSSQANLVLPYPYISRLHAEIRFDPSSQRFELVRTGGDCFLKGEQITRHTLSAGEEFHLGLEQGPMLVFSSAGAVDATGSFREALNHLKESSGSESGLGKLSWFVAAARRLNNVGAVEEILAALIDATLELTQVERGYVFLKNSGGKMHLAAGRSLKGEALQDNSTLSHSAIQQAIDSGSEFIVTDTLSADAAAPSESIMIQSIRAIICIPLRRRSSNPDDAADAQVLGVLYLDSRQQRSRLTQLDSDLLRTIAAEATLLVENTTLVQAEAAARRYREELLIASEIQQGLMSVRIPELSFARVEAHSVPCTGIGGDFYDVISHKEDLYIVVADISGKGVSAAVLGSTLQGLIHGQILSGLPLAEIALFANRYICHKNIRKYATLILLRLQPDGHAEYVNCGHVKPLLHGAIQTAATGSDHTAAGTGSVTMLDNCNLPVGLFSDAAYVSETLWMSPGQRIIVITDGITEAEDPQGEYFGEGHLQELLGAGRALHQVFSEITAFTAGAPLADDCTMVEVRYGPGGPIGPIG